MGVILVVALICGFALCLLLWLNGIDVLLIFAIMQAVIVPVCLILSGAKSFAWEWGMGSPGFTWGVMVASGLSRR